VGKVPASAGALVIWPLELTREVGRIREYGHVYVMRRVSSAAAVARSPDCCDQHDRSIPVLLTSGDHDGVDPPVNADADYAYYQQHCGCDVTQVLLHDTAHLFMVHQSLPVWVNQVVAWLSAKSLPPARPMPPVRCTHCVVPSVRLRLR
jgi:hypothetical protein